MSFFERQDRARRRTRLLVVLFALALLSILVVIDLIVLAFVAFSSEGIQDGLITRASITEHLELLIWVSVLTGGTIGLASFSRILTLRGGGAVVARSLGGVLVGADTGDPKLKRLRNVVEEMAIASGVPVPQIFVLEQEEGINAFAAGYSPADAAIAVTRGALHALNRTELQGVIAHEFSHILNGDMRLNIRLIGILFGIMVLAMLGRLLASARRAGANRQQGALVLIGLAVVTAGYIGHFFGRLIQAAVSRQREFLADASAVQFTRDPSGIAGALKKIGASATGSTLHGDTLEIAHMLFATGVPQRWLATHPPLIERIRAIEPSFDPRELMSLRRDMAQGSPAAGSGTSVTRGWSASPATSRSDGVGPQEATLGIAAAEGAGDVYAREARAASAEVSERIDTGGRLGAAGGPGRTSAADPDARTERIIGHIGQPNQAQIRIAASLARRIPAVLARAAHTTDWVKALMCALLIDQDRELRERQLLMVAQRLGAGTERQVNLLLDATEGLAPELRIPLLEIAFPTLRRLPQSEIEGLMDLIEDLIHADGRVDVFEYLLARLLAALLRDSMSPSVARIEGRARLGDHSAEARDVLLIFALHGNPDQRAARAAFAAGLAALELNTDEVRKIRQHDWPQRLDRALDALDRLRLEDKERFLRALLASAKHAGINHTETELMRAILAAIHIPMPALDMATP